MSAFALGILVALALPPFNLWPCLIGFAGLLHLLRQSAGPWRAALLGWWFGFGHLLAGLYWIAIAFFTDAERFGLLALPAVALLCAGMALYPALAAAAARLRRWRSPAAAALALALAWTAAEMLRGQLFGGFPWNLIGYAFAGSDAMVQLAALTGVWGLSLLAVLAGALPAALLEPGGALAAGRGGGPDPAPAVVRRGAAPRGQRPGAARPAAPPGPGQRRPASQVAAGAARAVVPAPPRAVGAGRRTASRR